MSHLLILTGRHRGKKMSLPSRDVVIGRDPECDIRLNSELISRRQCLLKATPQGVWVEDLNSQNGTYVNEVAVTEATMLEPGDQLRVGATVFELADDSAPPVEPKARDEKSISERDIESWLNEPVSEIERLKDTDTAVIDVPPASTSDQTSGADDVPDDPLLQQAARIIREHWSR